MKGQDRIWILMARKLSGEATAEEIAELERFQQQHPEMTYSLQMIADLWRSQNPTDDAEADQAFNRHLTRMALRDIQPAEPAPNTPANPRGPGATAGAAPTNAATSRASFAQTRDLVANYFNTTLRSLRRNKGFTAINIS